jgi:predicted cupin superfamily sugar epimerase
MKDGQYWIRKLQLAKHPEGGYFKETYRSDETIPAAALPPRFDGVRAFSTAIYFLLTGGECSALHRIKSDEMWHFYAGSELTIHVIEPMGSYSQIKLGGDHLQAVVSAGCWFGATVDDPESYALVGCTVAPGFDFTDFELARRDELIAQFPRHRMIVEKLTR